MNKNRLFTKQRIKDLFHSDDVLRADMQNLWFEDEPTGCKLLLLFYAEARSRLRNFKQSNYKIMHMKSIIIVINSGVKAR